MKILTEETGTPVESFPDTSAQQRFWETWNAAMRDPEHLNSWCMRRAETILQLLQSLHLERPRILDLGCGTGWLSAMLADFGPTTGIDLAGKVIAAAKVRFPSVTFLSGDILRASLPAGHFDVVVSQEVIAHVPDQAAYVHRAADVLKPGGYLIITTPNKFVTERTDFPPQAAEHIELWLTMRQLKRLLLSHFQVLRSMTILPMGQRGILRFVNSAKTNRMLAWLISQERIESLKARVGLGYTLIVLAQKPKTAVSERS